MMPIIFLFLHGPLILLVILALLCVFRLTPERRRGFLPLVAVVGLLAAVLFGGAWLLRQFGLEWRMLPKTVLGAVIWILGLIAGILTARYTLRWLDEHRPKLALWGTALALYCLISVMGAGSILGGLWALIPTEQTGSWQGQTVVQCAWEFLETSYGVYEYHGPLVREAEALAWSEEPMIEESIQRAMVQGVKAASRALGVSLEDGSPQYYENTHGWFGDGETFLTIAFEEEPEWLTDWKELPLTGNLVQVNESLAKNFFPGVQQGWYFFKDRHSQSQDSTDDSQLFSRASWNFTLAVYDSQTDTLYYYVLDT